MGGDEMKQRMKEEDGWCGGGGSRRNEDERGECGRVCSAMCADRRVVAPSNLHSMQVEEARAARPLPPRPRPRRGRADVHRRAGRDPHAGRSADRIRRLRQQHVTHLPSGRDECDSNSGSFRFGSSRANRDESDSESVSERADERKEEEPTLSRNEEGETAARPGDVSESIFVTSFDGLRRRRATQRRGPLRRAAAAPRGRSLCAPRRRRPRARALSSVVAAAAVLGRARSLALVGARARILARRSRSRPPPLPTALLHDVACSARSGGGGT